MKAPVFALIAVALALPVGSHAANDHSGHHATPAATQDGKMVEGLVKKLDRSAGKVTLAHGPLTNLGMPAMTMAFPVKNPAWLGEMKEGDQIRFVAETVNGTITIVRFEATKKK